MPHELVQLFKRTLVQQQMNSFTSRQLSGVVLAFTAFGAAAGFGFEAAAAQLLDALVLETGRRSRLLRLRQVVLPRTADRSREKSSRPDASPAIPYPKAAQCPGSVPRQWLRHA